MLYLPMPPSSLPLLSGDGKETSRSRKIILLENKVFIQRTLKVQGPVWKLVGAEVNLRLSQAGVGLLSTESEPRRRPGWDPRIRQAGRQGAVQAPGLCRAGANGPVRLPGSVAQQLTKYIPVGVGP